MAIEMVQIKKLSEQRKWMKRFAKGYDGSLLPITNDAFNPKIVKFFVAKEGNKELGFIRINDKSPNFNPTDEVWCVQDAYVKPVYRGKGVLKAMLQFVMDVEAVGMCHLAPEVLLKNYPYYKGLGFSTTSKSPTGLVYMMTDEVRRLREARIEKLEAA